METADERPIVLIVDDTPINLLLLKRILEKDYIVHSAASGQDALTSVHTSPRIWYYSTS